MIFYSFHKPSMLLEQWNYRTQKKMELYAVHYRPGKSEWHRKGWHHPGRPALRHLETSIHSWCRSLVSGCESSLGSRQLEAIVEKIASQDIASAVTMQRRSERQTRHPC